MIIRYRLAYFSRFWVPSIGFSVQVMLEMIRIFTEQIPYISSIETYAINEFMDSTNNGNITARMMNRK